MAYESIITDELPAGITLVDGLGYEYITGRLEAQKVDFETKWGPRNGQPDHFRHARIIVPKAVSYTHLTLPTK